MTQTFNKIASLPLVFSLLFLAGCSISPTPLTDKEIEARAIYDLEEIRTSQFLDENNPITIYEAIARAMKHNLDYRLKIMEEALAVKQLDAARYDLLPEISASAGYNSRNNEEGSVSQSLIDGTQSLVASTSSEKQNVTSDISIMWNVLDFGVSYARAKQQADRVMIVEERKRKVIQNIIQDVRYAYWRAVSSERLIKGMVELLEQSKLALKHSREIADQRLQSPKEALEYQKGLLENIRLLWNIIETLTPAKVELAALMNLPPGTNYTLAEPDWRLPEIPSFTLPIDQMEQIALVSRPELREEDYRARMSAEDVRKSILQMLPGVSLKVSGNYDSNDFLYNQSWWNLGAVVSQNVVQLFAGPEKIKAAKSQQEIDIIRRQAISIAVIVQVNLAHQRFSMSKKEYLVAKHLDRVNTKLNKQTAEERKAGGLDELTVIKSATNALIAKMRHYQDYAEMQNAAGRLYNSLGVDLPLTAIRSDSLPTLTGAIEEAIGKWQLLVNRKLTPEARLAAQIPGTAPEDELDLDDIFIPAANQADSESLFLTAYNEKNGQETALETLLADEKPVEKKPTPVQQAIPPVAIIPSKPPARVFRHKSQAPVIDQEPAYSSVPVRLRSAPVRQQAFRNSYRDPAIDEGPVIIRLR